MWFKTCLLVFFVPGLLAILPVIDEKYLQDIMLREGPKENLAVERVKLLKFEDVDGLPSVHNQKAELEIFLKSSEPIKKTLLIIYYPLDPITLFKEVFPKMDEFQAKSVLGAQVNMWPRVYNVEKYENQTRFIIENVFDDYNFIKTSSGYKGLDLDMESSKLVVGKLADFQALSAVLRQKNLIDATPFDMDKQISIDGKVDYFNKTFTDFAKSIRTAWGPEWENTAKYFEEKNRALVTEVVNMWRSDDSKFSVLDIGVLRNYNIMFQYKTTDQKHPIAVKLVEYNLVFWGSPVLDLQDFINSSPQLDIVTDDARREEIVKHYTEILADHLKKYGNETPIAKEYISDEIRRTELYGLVVAIKNMQRGRSQHAEETHTAESEDQMLNPTYIETMKKLVARAQKIGLIPH